MRETMNSLYAFFGLDLCLLIVLFIWASCMCVCVSARVCVCVSACGLWVSVYVTCVNVCFV